MGLSSLPDLAVAGPATAERDQADVDLLHGLVAIPSLSGDEAEAVAYLCQEMRTRGFEAAPDAAGSAVGVIGRGRRRIVLLGHIDTVPGEIAVRTEDGVLHGRGAVDAKGPLATFVAAAAAAADRADATITVVGAVGEESIGSPGANAVAAGPAPDYCIIGEPSGWDAVCLGYRGTLSFTYRLREAGRHTAGPGESVAEQAVAFWNALCGEVAARNGEATGFNALGHSLRGMWTESDGLFDEARLSIGVRLPPDIDVDELAGRLCTIAAPADLIVHGRQEGYATDKRSPITPPFLRAIRAAGGTPRFTRKLGTSDMTVVGPAWGCPIVAYGPGDASLDHTPEERIVLDDYLRAIRVLTDVLVSL
ncbi:MAG TPA: [LysW]-lysine hydrolase [Thermomicrobiales bacterium]|jgi:LysW-gamma-L-lysine carboxypeptidase